LSKRQASSEAQQDDLNVVKEEPSPVATHANMSAAAFRVAHSLLSSASWALVTSTANWELLLTPIDCRISFVT